MTLYLVERDVSGITMTQLCALLRIAEETSRSLSCDGRSIRHIRSIFLPGESRCLCLFEASSARLVREVNSIGQIPYTRIVNALEVTPR